MEPMTAEEIYTVPIDVYGWRVLPSGNDVKLGDGVTLGDDVKLGEKVKLGNDGLDYPSSPLQIQGSRNLLYVAGPSYIGIGCVRHRSKWWLVNYVKVGKRNGYTPAQIAEYKQWLDIAVQWQKTLKKG